MTHHTRSANAVRVHHTSLHTIGICGAAILKTEYGATLIVEYLKGYSGIGYSERCRQCE